VIIKTKNRKIMREM